MTQQHPQSEGKMGEQGSFALKGHNPLFAPAAAWEAAEPIIWQHT